MADRRGSEMIMLSGESRRESKLLVLGEEDVTEEMAVDASRSQGTLIDLFDGRACGVVHAS